MSETTHAHSDAIAIIEEWSKPQMMKLHAGEMTAGEVRAVQAVLAGVAAAVRALGPRASELDAAVIAERATCARVAREQGEKAPANTKAFKAYREACEHVERRIVARAEASATETERRLLEHALSLNPHGIGTRCATAEDIVVAKEMVAKGWLVERPDGRFITDAGRSAIG